MSEVLVSLTTNDSAEVQLLGFAIRLKRHWFGDRPIQVEIPISIMKALEHKPAVFREIFSDLLLDYGPHTEQLVTIYAVNGAAFRIRRL